MAIVARQAKRPFGLWVKMTAVTILGLCFIFVWTVFSSSSNSVIFQRESFEDIAQPVSPSSSHKQSINNPKPEKHDTTTPLKGKPPPPPPLPVPSHKKEVSHQKKKQVLHKEEHKEKQNNQEEEDGEQDLEIEDKKEGEELDSENEVDADTDGGIESVDVDSEILVEDENNGKGKGKGKGKVKGPLFDSNVSYKWKMCSTRSKHNYIPCIDVEASGGKTASSYRHTERSCPRIPLMCMVPLPLQGYESPVLWPESKLKMVPDIEWGKNIRVVLDIGCTDSSFAAALLDKDVLTLTLGLKDDLVDLAQVAIERGFPAMVSPFGGRRLPFPSQAFDAIHCGGCSITWHSNGGKHLLEMNRILRPGGYFIMSTKHDSIEGEEAMTSLTASICWNVLAHKSDDVGEVGVKIYQKPEGNDIYALRRKKIPPICKENENPDAVWHVPIKTCLHTIPIGIEQHGAEWPEEWPKRLESYPDWVNNKEKLVADTNHWNAIVNKSYLNGMGINWTNIRNVMDMKTTYGGLAASLSKQKVWVMNVVPVHAPDTLPIIFERGLFGVYHDWCESFGSYPRTYDLLHADHLFSRLKNRCRQPVSIVVEMDRILRPGGWTIIRDKVEILNPLEEILRSMHWEIRMTFNKDKEGIICAQKTTWRP